MFARFTCSDYCIRPLVSEVFERLGFSVVAPPRSRRVCRTGKCNYSYRVVGELLSRLGCNEVKVVHEELGVGKRARGDIDLMVYRDGVLVVAEVKTRLIVSSMSRPLLLAYRLQYHLDEPMSCLSAWKELTRLGGVSGRDSPESVGELVKSAAAGYFAFHGFNVELSRTCLSELQGLRGRPVNRLAVALVTMPYLNTSCGEKRCSELASTWVRRAASYISSCLGVDALPCIILVSVDESRTRIRLECSGECCTVLGLRDVRVDVRGVERCLEGCRSCRDCRFYATCRLYNAVVSL